MTQRTTLVTGAGRGAGLGIASALADQGGNLVVCDLDPDTSAAAAKLATERGARAVSIPCDVSDEVAVDAMFAQVKAEFGTLDALVNTVAWVDPPGPIAEMPTERWHKAIRTNLDSVMFCTRAALQIMIPQASGAIINVSSLNGTRGFPDRGSYGATKAAVINLAQTTAMENRAYGIRANCLVPGAINGERIRLLMEMAAARAAEKGADAEPPRPSFYPDPPIEFLDPEWVGRYVAFLLGDGGRHINGQALVIGEAPRSPLQAMFPDL
ncbi:MAG: 3-oxoacyl-[acyl-carrier-protein] reductase [Frankiales bacterium]|nr:3-oxoacyl-[acyl-carrier-protein] reductase [Frankiales bacterium]